MNIKPKACESPKYHKLNRKVPTIMSCINYYRGAQIGSGFVVHLIGYSNCVNNSSIRTQRKVGHFPLI